ncbi:PREDICTED: cytochrome P450 27C1 isoform X3 [Calidris pugnax]|uniref:cytochrome P450 27C1 isoform X3 n=1 Tax=Calidris pugnax TaxID=198806 RepID=UPI00071DECA6|nr:PREDICTED: cytochrome P450 27C1 isoform X3 [Calidris pugnax]
MSFFSRVLTMKCKQGLESERTYFYQAVFASRFHRRPPLCSPGSLGVRDDPPPPTEDKGAGAMVAAPGGPGELLEPTQGQLGRVKSLQEMPGPNTLYNLYEFFWKDGFGRIHEIQQKHTQEYGKIFKSHFGPQFVVSIADRDMVAQVLRAEGRAPQRANMESWQEYRDLRGRATGLISAEGEQWLKMRSVLRQKILKPKDVAVYSEGVNEVITDLIKRIYTLRSQEDDGETVTNVNNLFFKYSMEGQIHVDNKLKAIQSQLDQGEEVNGGLLTYLLVSKELTLEEIYANMTEMLLAGVDTTSFTLSWATYLLAKHPEVQQRVYEEIVNKLGKDQVPLAHDVPKLPLIRAVLKETLRLYPVLPGNGRVTQKDLIVGGYLIPKGTQLALCHYTTSYSEENFSMANEFRPERWLRKGNLDRVDNFGSIPFGYGIRSCIGKRVAELEIHLALIQLLQNFEIKISPKTEPVRAKTHGLLTPGNSINVRFSDRK